MEPKTTKLRRFIRVFLLPAIATCLLTATIEQSCSTSLLKAKWDEDTYRIQAMGLALTRYMNDHEDHLPKKLAELVPDYLSEEAFQQAMPIYLGREWAFYPETRNNQTVPPAQRVLLVSSQSLRPDKEYHGRLKHLLFYADGHTERGEYPMVALKAQGAFP